MLPFLALLLVVQLIGEAIVAAADLPVPGPVVGMALLFAGLAVRDALAGGGVPEGLERTAGALLQHLSLLFVPAGVGVVLYLSVLREEWLPIAVAVVAGTMLAIAVTGAAMAGLLRLFRGEAGEGGRR
jgi:holin-like protein